MVLFRLMISLEKEKKSLEYLRRMDFKNFHEIVEHWRITFAYRKDIFEDSEKDIEQILGDQWKPLKSSHGHILVKLFLIVNMY